MLENLGIDLSCCCRLSCLVWFDVCNMANSTIHMRCFIDLYEFVELRKKSLFL